MTLYLHEGKKCRGSFDETESCQDLETVYKDFTEDNLKLAEFYVFDCQDLKSSIALEPDAEKRETMLMSECREENAASLPTLVFLQPPLRKYNPNTNSYIGHMKSQHNKPHTVQHLTDRLTELQPNFYIQVRDRKSVV